jgi:glycosyltransferase involved in cell wall biosynthesis
VKIVYLLSHPIQYFSPLLQKLDKEEDIDLMVYYCTDQNLGDTFDPQFGQKVTWDVPLLEGYKYKFLKNHSPWPGLARKSTGLINLGIYAALRNDKPHVLVLNGWAYSTTILAMISAKILGIRVWMRSESPLKQEKSNWIKRIYKKVIFCFFCHKFLYIGEENKKFYLSYGITSDKLIFTPYSVDNERFGKEYAENKHRRAEFRKLLGIEESAVVYLFSGKFIYKKRPMTLLAAFKELADKNARLIMLGNGELLPIMEKWINENNLNDNVILPGFVNQTDLHKYFIASDVFVLPSGIGETWGLVVNEAMNFHLPVIVSDMVGSTADLVKNGVNGFTFPLDNTNALQQHLAYFLKKNISLYEMGLASSKIITNYSTDVIIQNFKQVQI